MAGTGIGDVMQANTVLDAACQEMEWAYGRRIWDQDRGCLLGPAAIRMRKVLDEAEKRWIRVVEEEEEEEEDGATPIIGDWLTRVKNVADEIRAAARKELLGSGRKDGNNRNKVGNTLIARMLPCLASKTATKDSIRGKLEALMAEYEGLPVVSCMEQPSCVGQQTAILTHVPLAREREDDKKRIIDIITEQAERETQAHPVILPIFGPAGIGKTTLVNSIFHDPELFQGYAKAWINYTPVEPQGSEEISILRSIISQAVPGAESSPSSLDGMKKLFVEHFGSPDNKKLLLVIDDPCVETHGWGNGQFRYSSGIGNFLRNLPRENVGNSESLDGIGGNLVVIVTTSSQSIADNVTSTAIKPYQLHPLSHDTCWKIIKQTSNFEERIAGNHQEAEAAAAVRIGREIASKCWGLPFAAKALGRFLRTVDPQQWPTVVGDSQDIWNVGGKFSRDSQPPLHSLTVFTHFKRSSHRKVVQSWLRFAFCAFFSQQGRRQTTVLYDLEYQLFCLGITTRQDRESHYWNLSRVQQPAPVAGVLDNSDAALLTMNDVMRDFGRYLLGDRLIVVDGRRNGPSSQRDVNKKNSSSSSAAYFAVVSNWDGKTQLDLPAGILALRFEGCGEITEVSDSTFAAAFGEHLRVLDLSGCFVNKFPDSIGELKQLRYLEAPGIQDKVFPRAITRLHELRYLNLRGWSCLPDLGDDFGRRSRLLSLDLSGCSGLKALPSDIGWLWTLERLDLSGCSGITALPDTCCCLTNLILLHLAGCSGLTALPPQLFSKLRRLEYLNLSGCSGLTTLPDTFRVRKLSHLDLSCCWRLKALPREMDPVGHVDLSGCSSLEALPDAMELEGVHHLDLSGCISLQTLPRNLSNLWFLHHLDLSGCSKLQLQTKLSEISGLTHSCMHLDLSGCWSIQDETSFVETIRSKGGRASGPQDAPLKLIRSCTREPEITDDDSQ